MPLKWYLSEWTLNLSKEIIIGHLRSLVVNVIHGKTQSLHLLKVIVQLKSTRKLRTEAVLYVLGPPELRKQQLSTSKHTHTLTHTHSLTHTNNLGEPVPEETFTHSHLSWSSVIPYLLPPSPFLHWMPFLAQPSQFILAWDWHQICWLAYPVHTK